MSEEKTLEELIEPAWLETYKQERDNLHRELVELNSTVFILEKIESFPFNVFLPLYDDRIFWHVTRNALVERAIMIAWRIIVDPDEKTLTLQRFRENVAVNVQLGGQVLLNNALNRVDFENRMKELQQKIIYARHNYLAHFNYKLNTDRAKAVRKLQLHLEDIKSVVEIARELFNALCLTHLHSLWLWGYLGSAREREITDIDELLDSVAHNSVWINMPETDPDLWQERRSEISIQDRDKFNLYRSKFGLAQVE